MWEIGVAMQGIRVEIRGIRVKAWEIGGGNKGNHDENPRIEVDMMNKKYGEG